MKIGLCTGCFDVLHIGHIRLLQYAKQHCDKLIVGINSDVSITKLKGPTRPINSESIRKEFLLSLQCVDCVEIFNEDTPSQFIKRISPDIFVKGTDYNIETLKEDCAYSPSTRILQFDIQQNFSTTSILNKI
jgi:D-beta-D-heptose 7-phosphate kinase / D-beta-D-heptose 1-phosphate adenosyltransferase